MTRWGDGPGEWIAQLYDRHAAGLYRYALMVLANLKRAVRSECFSMLRSRRRDGPPIDHQRLLDGVHAADDRIDERLAIERALRELPPEQREVVHLRIFEGREDEGAVESKR